MKPTEPLRTARGEPPRALAGWLRGHAGGAAREAAPGEALGVARLGVGRWAKPLSGGCGGQNHWDPILG